MQKLEIAVLRKLFRLRIIGGKHTSFDNASKTIHHKRVA
jgi:hypothetical protein